MNQKPFKAPASCAWVHFADTCCSAAETWCKVKKQCIKNERILISPWENLWDGFTSQISRNFRFVVRDNNTLIMRGILSNWEEFSFCCKRQKYFYNERNTLKLRGNCERNFDRAFSSSFEIIFFWVYDGKCRPRIDFWNVWGTKRSAQSTGARVMPGDTRECIAHLSLKLH